MIPKLRDSKMHSEEFSLFELISIDPVNPKVDISNIFDQSKKIYLYMFTIVMNFELNLIVV